MQNSLLLLRGEKGEGANGSLFVRQMGLVAGVIVVVLKRRFVRVCVLVTVLFKGPRGCAKEDIKVFSSSLSRHLCFFCLCFFVLPTSQTSATAALEYSLRSLTLSE